MGITISHKLSQLKNSVKSTLDRAEKLAEKYKEQAKIIDVPITIERYNDYNLRIDIGNCETLAFYFQSKETIEQEAKTGWSYIHEQLTDGGKKQIDNGYKIDEFPQNEIYFCSGFCKTQFAKSLTEHRFVAELIRIVASYCLTADVSDEGDYYNTGDIMDAKKAIKSNGALIDSLTKTLSGMGYETLKGGETNIK